MAAEFFGNVYAAAPGSTYWSKTSIESTDWSGPGTINSRGFDVVGFRLLKQDFTGTDPLSVTLDDPDWVSLASVGPRNVPGWTSAPSYIATRWFYRVGEPNPVKPLPTGSTTADFWIATAATIGGVVPVPLDLYVDSSITDVPTSYTLTPTVPGLVISHFFNGILAPFVAAPCIAGTSITVGFSGGLSYDWLAFVLEERRTKGIFVGAVVF